MRELHETTRAEDVGASRRGHVTFVVAWRRLGPLYYVRKWEGAKRPTRRLKRRISISNLS